jgi:hypothetical protein
MGYLRKQGGGTSVMGRKNWKKRFFVLEGASLSYYEDEETRMEKKPLNAQPYVLPFCDVLLDTAADEAFSGVGKQKFCFTVKPCSSRGGKGPLSLEAESFAMRDTWMTMLKRAQNLAVTEMY